MYFNRSVQEHRSTSQSSFPNLFLAWSLPGPFCASGMASAAVRDLLYVYVDEALHRQFAVVATWSESLILLIKGAFVSLHVLSKLHSNLCHKNALTQTNIISIEISLSHSSCVSSPRVTNFTLSQTIALPSFSSQQTFPNLFGFTETHNV